jgi:hypothetical protein
MYTYEGTRDHNQNSACRARPVETDRPRHRREANPSLESAGQRRGEAVGPEGAAGPAVSPTRARDAAVSKYEDAAEIQFSSRPRPESFQSGAASHHPAGLQAETLDCIGGVARTCRVGRRLRTGVLSSASVNPVTLTTPWKRFLVNSIIDAAGDHATRTAYSIHHRSNGTAFGRGK